MCTSACPHGKVSDTVLSEYVLLVLYKRASSNVVKSLYCATVGWPKPDMIHECMLYKPPS